MNQLEHFSTKDDLITYAESLGITNLKKNKSLANLKKDLTSELMNQTITQVAETKTTTIQGEDTILVLKGSELIIELPVSELEKYCTDELHIHYRNVTPIINKTWVNVHGYSFKENINGKS